MTSAEAPAARLTGLLASIGRCEYPVVGVAAVILGAFISSLNTRISTFGLADIRGGLGLGFDEASWFTTVFGAAQMVVTPAAAWMSTVLGTRRVLLWTGTVFTVASLLPPLTHDYDTLIALQLIRGLSVGAFIPAALGFVLRSLAPRWWIWGIAAYAFRFVFSQNIAGAVEGWYSEGGHWRWIFWQSVPLSLVMLALVAVAMPRRPIDRALLPQTDWPAIVYAGLGFGLIYAGLDQGNRLDWLNSGLVCGLLLGGMILVVAFFLREARAPYPLIHLRILVQPYVAVPAVLVSLYGFGSTATGFVLPDYLTRIQGLRDLQIGDTLNLIALPQFVLVPLVALLVRRIDARLPLVFGFAMIAIGSWMDTGLTHDWAGGDFLPSQCIEAVGLAFAITAFGVMVAARIKQIQSFMAITQMVMMPMYFLSGAIFPVAGLPAWLTVLNRLDPMTYAVDPMRRLVFNHLHISAAARRTLDPGVTWWGWHVPTVLEAGVVAAIGLLCLAIGVVEFSGRE